MFSGAFGYFPWYAVFSLLPNHESSGSGNSLKPGIPLFSFVGNLNYTNSVNDRYLGYYKALLEKDLNLDPAYRIDDRNEQGIHGGTGDSSDETQIPAAGRKTEYGYDQLFHQISGIRKKNRK